MFWWVTRSLPRGRHHRTWRILVRGSEQLMCRRLSWQLVRARPPSQSTTARRHHRSVWQTWLLAATAPRRRETVHRTRLSAETWLQRWCSGTASWLGRMPCTPCGPALHCRQQRQTTITMSFSFCLSYLLLRSYYVRYFLQNGPAFGVDKMSSKPPSDAFHLT